MRQKKPSSSSKIALLLSPRSSDLDTSAAWQHLPLILYSLLHASDWDFVGRSGSMQSSTASAPAASKLSLCSCVRYRRKHASDSHSSFDIPASHASDGTVIPLLGARATHLCPLYPACPRSARTRSHRRHVPLRRRFACRKKSGSGFAFISPGRQVNGEYLPRTPLSSHVSDALVQAMLAHPPPAIHPPPAPRQHGWPPVVHAHTVPHDGRAQRGATAAGSPAPFGAAKGACKPHRVRRTSHVQRAGGAAHGGREVSRCRRARRVGVRLASLLPW